MKRIYYLAVLLLMLVAAAGAVAALELARLDELSPKNSARAVFVGKLGDAANALAALYEAGVRGGTPASHRVSELTAEIQADAVARTKAKEDMGRLLG